MQIQHVAADTAASREGVAGFTESDRPQEKPIHQLMQSKYKALRELASLFREFPHKRIPTSRYGVGRGCGVGRGRGVTLGVAVGGGVVDGVGVAVGVTDGVTVGVADGVTVGVAVGVGVGDGVGPAPAQKISIDATGTPVMS
jgi:hypothetical protein